LVFTVITRVSDIACILSKPTHEPFSFALDGLSWAVAECIETNINPAATNKLCKVLFMKLLFWNDDLCE
jgi:hypothetical protein